MKKIVFTYPNKELRKRSQEISVEQIQSESMQVFITDLKDTMAEENGVGIAAPQIGIPKRIIVVETESGSQAFFNPKIVRYSIRKTESEEGCLSVPGVFGIVRRSKSVVINAYNEQAQPVTIRVKAFPAIVFQHEIDHLDGILFIDKVERYTKHQEI